VHERSSRGRAPISLGALHPHSLLSGLTIPALFPLTAAGQTRGQISPGHAKPNPNMASEQGFFSWGGLDSNQRPTDYESATRVLVRTLRMRLTCENTARCNAVIRRVSRTSADILRTRSVATK
jgi:hypothetical protein